MGKAKTNACCLMPIACLWLDQAKADGVAHKTGYLVNIQLFHQVGSMGLGGLDTQSKELGNLLGSFPLCNKL